MTEMANAMIATEIDVCMYIYVCVCVCIHTISDRLTLINNLIAVGKKYIL